MADRGRRETPDPGEEHLVPDPQRPGAWLVRIGGADQSWVDPAHPTLLEFDYMERIADHLDLHRPAGERMRVVHIGGAGMNLARYVSATRPTSPQIVLEPDAGLTEEVRRKAPLPPRSGIKVRPLDGRAGIAAMREDFADVVILDAFAGARVPGELVTAECFADISREVFGQVVLEAESATLKGRRYGNVILAASHAPLPVDEVTRRCAGAPFPFRVVHGPALERMAGGATPFTDEAPEPSPGPPGGASYFA